MSNYRWPFDSGHGTIKHTDAQIVALLREYKAGKPMSLICRENGIDYATFCGWYRKYCGRSDGYVNTGWQPGYDEMVIILTMDDW